MNRKEQIAKIIKGEMPDYTPHHFDLTMRMTDRLAEYYGIDRDGAEDHIGNHLLYLDFTGAEGRENGYRDGAGSGEAYIDEFGVEWDVSKNYDVGDWGMRGSVVKDMDLSGYAFPDGLGEGRFQSAKSLMNRYSDRFNVLRISGPFDLGWRITGLSDFLSAMVTDEKIIFHILERTTNYIRNIIEAAPEGVDAVRILEDWGLQKGLLFSKSLWMKYIYPCYETLHATIRKKGLAVFHHSCGDVTELMPEIIKLGVDVLDAIQREAMDIKYVKREFGKYIVLFGGLGSQSTIPLGTPAQVVREAEETVALMGKGGRYILGPSGSIPTDAPMENVVALVDYCKTLERRSSGGHESP
jgi:uroporphyrinogen decarboxylase